MFSGGMKVDYLLKMSLKRIKSTCFNCTIFLNYGRTGNAPTTPCNPPISLIELWEFNRTKIENLSNEDIINAINQKPLLRYWLICSAATGGVLQNMEFFKISQISRPATLLKRDSSTDLFLCNLLNFQEHLFWRTSANELTRFSVKIVNVF